jgi:hypothetical protein
VVIDYRDAENPCIPQRASRTIARVVEVDVSPPDLGQDAREAARHHRQNSEDVVISLHCGRSVL